MLELLFLDHRLSLEHTLLFPLQSASLFAAQISLLCELTSPMEPQLTELVGLQVQPPSGTYSASFQVPNPYLQSLCFCMRPHFSFSNVSL